MCKLCSASEFVWSETPLDILGSVNLITFKDPESLPIKNHILTSEEVLFFPITCECLKVTSLHVPFDDYVANSALCFFNLQQVKALCDDLGVLGKQDFKHLLK